MNVVKIMGGLGNQLFQYAIGQKLKQYDSIGYDISYYSSEINKNGDVPHRDLLLPWLVDGLVFSDQEDRERVNQWEYDPSKVYQNKYFWGDWQKAKFFEGVDLGIHLDEGLMSTNDIINEGFVMFDFIQSLESVAIHVRRTDYEGLGWLLPMNYYKRAIERIQQKVNNAIFFVFSDDIPWCQENIQVPDGYYLHYAGPLTDFYLMSQCKHQIIANSFFSFWAAYLNPNPEKIVIYPENWICTSNPCEGLNWEGL